MKPVVCRWRASVEVDTNSDFCEVGRTGAFPTYGCTGWPSNQQLDPENTPRNGTLQMIPKWLAGMVYWVNPTVFPNSQGQRNCQKSGDLFNQDAQPVQVLGSQRYSVLLRLPASASSRDETPKLLCEPILKTVVNPNELSMVHG